MSLPRIIRIGSAVFFPLLKCALLWADPNILDILTEIRKPQTLSQGLQHLDQVITNNEISENFKYQFLTTIGDEEIKECEAFLNDIVAKEKIAVFVRGAAYLSLWKIRFSKLDNKEDIEFFKQALKAYVSGLGDGGVRKWAAGELANMGAIETLPMIQESIREISGDKTAVQITNLSKRKMELIRGNVTKIVAFEKALEVSENDVDLGKWSINELGKIGSQETRSILVRFARSLQERYYIVDERGIAVVRDQSAEIPDIAGILYGRAISSLEASGMTTKELTEQGLQPKSAFLIID